MFDVVNGQRCGRTSVGSTHEIMNYGTREVQRAHFAIALLSRTAYNRSPAGLTLSSNITIVGITVNAIKSKKATWDKKNALKHINAHIVSQT